MNILFSRTRMSFLWKKNEKNVTLILERKGSRIIGRISRNALISLQLGGSKLKQVSARETCKCCSLFSGLLCSLWSAHRNLQQTSGVGLHPKNSKSRKHRVEWRYPTSRKQVLTAARAIMPYHLKCWWRACILHPLQVIIFIFFPQNLFLSTAGYSKYNISILLPNILKYLSWEHPIFLYYHATYVPNNE